MGTFPILTFAGLKFELAIKPGAWMAIREWMSNLLPIFWMLSSIVQYPPSSAFFLNH